MATDRYRHLAFQINQFYKQNGYMEVSDLITYLKDDIESINTIGEVTTIGLSEKVNYEEIEDYLNNIREYNEKEHCYRDDVVAFCYRSNGTR